MNNNIDIAKRTDGDYKVSSNRIETTSFNYEGNTIAELNTDLSNYEANAAFIVKACNNYDKLVEELKNVLWNFEGKPKYMLTEVQQACIKQVSELLKSIEQDTLK